MDDATAETVLSLQLEDLDGILAGEEATEEIGEVTDQRLAVTLYRDQLRERVSSLADRRMSLSIGSAVWQDGVLLTTSRAHEFAATRDRIVAQRLAGVPQVQCPLPNALPQTDLSDATIRHVAAYNAAAPIPVGSIFPVISSEHEHQSLGSMSKKRTRHHTANTEDASYDEQRALKRTKNTHHHSTSDTLEHAVARDIPKSPPRKRKRSTSNDVQTHEQAAASTISGTAYSEQFSDIDGVRSIQADLRAQEEESAGINPNKRIRAAALGQPAAEPESACIVCGDPGLYADLVKAPCEHSYCTDCITGFFEAGVKDGSVFPPKCCGQEIPLSIAAAYLSEDLVTKVNERAQANTSPNATYCAQPYCSVYIPPSNVELGHGTCPKCSTRTCCRCRKEARFGDCVKDEDLERVRELAKKEGWQACYDCNALIELNFGCNHMT